MMDFDKEIARLENELHVAREQKKIDDARSVKDKKLTSTAIRLHKLTCRWNHTDGCGWFYFVKDEGKITETHDWSEHAHSKYLGRAKKLIAFCDEHHMSIDHAIATYEMVSRD